jgi:signal transduction histidine kinase
LDGLADYAAAAVAPKLAPVRLDMALRQAMFQVDPEIQRSGAIVEFEEMPRVLGDFDQLSLMFKHLLQNAIRYRGQDPPEIRVTVEHQGENCVVKISDNGAGIAPRYADRVFTPYLRLEDRSRPGNGLGLAICKTVAEAHQGRIWLESEVGVGSTFFVALPAATGVASAAGVGTVAV